jgi:serine/threonine protein kinase
MLIGKSAFNSQSMQELVDKVQNGTYSIPTHLSKEVVSFLNAMLQFNSQKRLSCDELSRHAFLTKNVRDFEPIDLRKVSNKINRNNLNINIKRNNTIWSIFNQEDENKLINIPGNYLMPVIKEEDEFKYNINNYPYDTDINRKSNQNNNNTENYQGYGVGYDGINAYQNTNEKNAGYGFSNYPEQKYKIPQDNVPISIHENNPFIGKIENSQNNYQNEIKTEGQKIGPIAEIPSFGVPSPGEENKEGGYENSSGIFRSNINWGYTSGRGGYSYK